jgi:coenzyme F420-reducing hydrogenase alpha subunit
VETIGGRAVHPVSNVPGGFRKYPKKDNLKILLDNAKAAEVLGLETLKLFSSFKYPEISRKMIYSSLSKINEYSYYDGDVKATNGNTFRALDYKKYIYEEIVPYNRAKFGTLKGEVIMVGSIARIAINQRKLEERIGSLKNDLSISQDFNNPFDNIIAQAVENYYFIVESKEILTNLLQEGVFEEKVVEPKKFGDGASACEAPRGTLFHYYKFDNDGLLSKCDIITPTVQNLPALEKDMKKLGPILKDLDTEERNNLIEVLIRAYDPCITCATH